MGGQDKLPTVEFRKLPKVDRVVESPRLAVSRAAVGSRALTAIAREVVATWRNRIKSGAAAPDFDTVVGEVATAARRRLEAHQVRVVNATGVLLHTNLGRAPLPARSVERVAALAGGYQSVEFDVEVGGRSRRGASVERALAELAGAEDALVTNNNAAAVLLALSHLAAHKEVVVSRGELVEIGGGFRVPEVLERSGARLVEVGTTNRTRVEDYAAAITDKTACLLRVHPSNFKITGFTERPPLKALAELARSRDLPLVKDLGGGLMVEPRELSAGGVDFSSQPTVTSCIRAGCDLVCFSLDKLFGGPQGGVVVGSKALVERLRSDPLARAIRVDKLTLTTLEPVVDAYVRGDLDSIPVLRMLRTSLDDLEERLNDWRAQLGEHAERIEVVTTESAVGGGTLAEAPVESRGLAVQCEDPDAMARALRAQTPPVVARIADGRVLLDARSVQPDEDRFVVEALLSVL